MVSYVLLFAGVLILYVAVTGRSYALWQALTGAAPSTSTGQGQGQNNQPPNPPGGNPPQAR